MKKKAFQYLMMLLLGTTAAFADWSEDLNPSINDEAKDSCTCFSEDQATLGKDSSEEEIILGPTDTNDDTSYLEYLDIPFDLFWDLAERFGYINTYALLGEEAAERILEEIRERRTRGRASKYIAPTFSVAIAIIIYTMYPRCIDAYREYNRAVNRPVRVTLNAYALLVQLQDQISTIVTDIETERNGGDELQEDIMIDQRLLLTL